MLGIGRDKLYELTRSGRLYAVKDGRARFITATALAEQPLATRVEAETDRAALAAPAVVPVDRVFAVARRFGGCAVNREPEASWLPR